jgi:hypothetical protein
VLSAVEEISELMESSTRVVRNFKAYCLGFVHLHDMWRLMQALLGPWR